MVSDSYDGCLLSGNPRTVYLRRCVTVQCEDLVLAGERELRNHFERIGGIKHVVFEAAGCCAYLQFDNEEMATRAISDLDDSSIQIPQFSQIELRIRVTRTCFATSSPRRPIEPQP
ncbi:hypothetical protein SUGI_0104460 [Cryptomeria japonica]|nr:hypothetical protein SUGI_0104460 [Cryptomeria japonica]